MKRNQDGNSVTMIFFDFIRLIWRGLFGFVRFLVTPYSLAKEDNSSARWMSKGEQRKFLSAKNHGFVINNGLRLSLKDSNKNMVCISPTGGGKTTSVLTPNVLQLSDSSSSVILDVSGEIYNTTAGYLQARGFHVQVLDLTNPAESDLFYNPLARTIGNSTAERRVIKTLLQSVYGSNTNDAFWTSGAATLMHICIAAMNAEDPERVSLPNLKRMVVNLNVRASSEEPSYTEQYLAKFADEQSFAEFKSLQSEEKTFNNFITTASNALEFLNAEALEQITAKDSMDFEALREQKTVWYVKVKETEIKHCKVLLTLFFHELFHELMVMPNENEQSVSLFLDEARLLDFDLPYYLSISRKYRISSLLCYQSLSQIQSQFGVNDAKTLLNGGVFSKLILPGLNDPSELALIRDLLGYYLDESGKAKPLLNINQIRTLKDELLLFVGSLPPVKAPMDYYFKQKKFKKVATEYPPQKSITDKPIPDEPA